MTKTFTTVVTHRFAGYDLPVALSLDTAVGGEIVWNFEFESLGFI
jgi:hypothetical protein